MHPKIIAYNGRNYYLTGKSQRYYYADVREGNKRRKVALHRTVWEDANGCQVPEGCQVHHIDQNCYNNAADNLEAKPTGRHLREHMAERMSDPTYRKAAIERLATGQDAAAAWHASEAGIAVHKEIGRKSWENKALHSKHCLNCSKTYETPFPSRSKFCCVNCHHQYKDRNKAYFEARLCAQCGKEYSTRRSSKAQACSMACAGAWRRANGKKAT